MTANPRIEQIRRSTLASTVSDRLRELVISGSYEPGAQMNEVELAERFGVSRGPIREGLQLLVQEGLLHREPHRGVFVPVITDADIGDIYIAREAIEGSALRIALRDNADRPDRTRVLAPLHRTVKEMRAAAAAGHWSKVADLDMGFHRQIVAIAGSPRLARLFASLVDETRALLNMTASIPERETIVDEHAELVDLLERGDVEKVVSALAHHFRDSRDTLRRRRRLADEAQPREGAT